MKVAVGHEIRGCRRGSSITRVTVFYNREGIKYIKGFVLALVIDIFYTDAGYFLAFLETKSIVFSRKG